MVPASVPTERNVLEVQLRDLLCHALGSQVELEDYTICNQQPDYAVLLVRLRRSLAQVIVKLAGRDATMACAFDRTARLHQLVAARTGIPMPEVLAVDVSCRHMPWRYLIKRYIPGQEWATLREHLDARELANAYRQIGDAVAQLHAVRFPAFGEISADMVPKDASFTTSLAERARHFIQGERLQELFLAVLEQNAGLFSDVRHASLCHEDLHGYNILFRLEKGAWRLATILDFDKAWAGHGESDLARLEFWKKMTSKEFWTAYQQVHRIEPLYRERRLIYQLFWCLEYARPTAEHLADTRRVCAALGIASFEHF